MTGLKAQGLQDTDYNHTCLSSFENHAGILQKLKSFREKQQDRQRDIFSGMSPGLGTLMLLLDKSEDLQPPSGTWQLQHTEWHQLKGLKEKEGFEIGRGFIFS